MCDKETWEKLNSIEKGQNEINIWCAKRDETIMQHQRAIELLMTKAEKEISLSSKNYENCKDALQTLSKKFDSFLIDDYVPFRTKILTIVVLVSSVVGILIGIGLDKMLG